MPMSIVKIEFVQCENIIYNFSVDQDESYVANGMICHNCRCRSVPYFPDLPEEQLVTEDFNTWLQT